MPKSRHRKKHKQKVQARKNQKANKMAQIKNLTQQLNEAVASAKQTVPMQTIKTSSLTLPGQNNEPNYDEI